MVKTENYNNKVLIVLTLLLAIILLYNLCNAFNYAAGFG